MNKLKFIFAAFLLASTMVFSAEKLSLDDAINIGLENNHNVKIAEFDLRIAEEDVNEAFGYAMPNISLNSSYQRNVILPKFVFEGSFFPPELINFTVNASEELGLANPFAGVDPDADPEPVAAGLRNVVNTTVELNQTIFNYNVFKGIGATSIYKKAKEEGLSAQESNTVKDSKMAFYNALLTKESISLVEESLENAKKRYEEIAVLYENGLVSEFDELRSSVQVENLKSEISNAKTNYRNALNGLKITIGYDPSKEIEIEGDLDTYTNEYEAPTKGETEKEIKSGNLDLKAIDYQVEVQQAFVESEIAGFYPIVNLFANYSYQGQANDFDFITFDQSAVGLRLSWTIFQGFQRSAKLQKAKLNKEKSLVQKDLLERSLNNQAELIALRMQTAKEQIEAGSKTVKQAERGYEIANLRYQEGIGSLLEINDADLALRQAKLNKLQAVFNYLVAEADYENLKGKK